MCSAAKITFLLAFLTTFSPLATAWANETGANENNERLFFKATEAYEKGDVSTATSGFYQLLMNGQRGAAIWYNLGNSYYRSGQNGAALWAFKEAARLAPRWDNLEANLALLKHKAIDELPPLHSAWRCTLFFGHYIFSFKERLMLLIVFNTFFWGLLIAAKRRKSDLLSLATIFSLFFTIFFSLSLLKELFFTTPEGVVKVPAVAVRSAGQPMAQPLFELHECTELLVEEAQNGWLLVSLSDGKRGWINEEAVAWRLQGETVNQ